MYPDGIAILMEVGGSYRKGDSYSFKVWVEEPGSNVLGVGVPSRLDFANGGNGNGLSSGLSGSGLSGGLTTLRLWL